MSVAVDQVAGEEFPPRYVELFIKSGKDGNHPGGCPLCQRMHIILLIKARSNEITLTVTKVNPAKPPENFRKIASRLPALSHADDVICDPDEMIQYIDDHFPNPSLAYDNVEAANASQDIFSKFSFYVKDVSHSSSHLLAELERLNAYLEKSGHVFLCRDSLDHLDCMMIPKLQHIRVVARAFKDFEIPSRLSSFWGYMDAAYKSDIFRDTSPSDQEIIRHWMDKKECSMLTKEKRSMLLSESDSTYSFTTPEGTEV